MKGRTIFEIMLRVRNVFLIATLVFAVQVLGLLILSVFLSPTRFRTGLNEFLLDGTEYSALVSFGIALLACKWLSRELNELRKNRIDVITWEMDKPEEVHKKLKNEWKIRTYSWEHLLVLIVGVCVSYLMLTRMLGEVESREPMGLTLVLMMNDFLAIIGLVSILYFSYLVSRSISPISRISVGNLNFFHVDGIGGMSKIGNLASYRSLFLGLALGFWLVPFLLYCYFTPFLRARLGPEIASIAMPIELLIIAVTTLLPLSFFVYDARNIHRYILRFKNRETDKLARKYVDASVHHRYGQMLSLNSKIEKIANLKEWPLGSVNVASIAVTIAFPLLEFVVKQLLMS